MTEAKKVVAIGCDEAGYGLKELIKQHLASQGVDVQDYGCHSTDPVDYPDVAVVLAKDVAAHKIERGILICGTGIGMAIAANRHAGIRAVNCSDVYTARLSRSHNDSNILSIGERVVGAGLAWGSALVRW